MIITLYFLFSLKTYAIGEGGSSVHSPLMIKFLPGCGFAIFNMSPQRYSGIIKVALREKERAHGGGTSLLSALIRHWDIPSYISFIRTDHVVPFLSAKQLGNIWAHRKKKHT